MSLEGLQLPANVIGKLYKEIFVTEAHTYAKTELSPVVETSSLLQTVEKVSLPADTQSASTAPQQIQAEPATPLIYLGSNQQQIAILVNYPKDKHIAEAPLDLLSKMLAACQLNLGSVAIINVSQQKVNYQILQEQLQSKKVFLFGLDASSIALPMQFPLYKDQSFANTVYLQSDSLDLMLPNTAESKQLKSALWAAFKRIFNL